MDSGLSSRINLVILDGAHDFRSTFNTGSDEIRKQVRLVALFGRDRRVGECLLLREERKSGLRGRISVFDPKRSWRLRQTEWHSTLFERNLPHTPQGAMC